MFPPKRRWASTRILANSRTITSAWQSHFTNGRSSDIVRGSWWFSWYCFCFVWLSSSDKVFTRSRRDAEIQHKGAHILSGNWVRQSVSSFFISCLEFLFLRASASLREINSVPFFISCILLIGRWNFRPEISPETLHRKGCGQGLY